MILNIISVSRQWITSLDPTLFFFFPQGTEKKVRGLFDDAKRIEKRLKAETMNQYN